jgi:hypothetical protein
VAIGASEQGAPEAGEQDGRARFAASATGTSIYQAPKRGPPLLQRVWAGVRDWFSSLPRAMVVAAVAVAVVAVAVLAGHGIVADLPALVGGHGAHGVQAAGFAGVPGILAWLKRKSAAASSAVRRLGGARAAQTARGPVQLDLGTEQVTRLLGAAPVYHRFASPRRDLVGRDLAGTPPTIWTLRQFTGKPWLIRILVRYLIPRNPEASLRRHQQWGTPAVRTLVMSTVGRLISRPGRGGNYRLNNRRAPLEATTDFALRASLFNEAIHLVVAGWAAYGVLPAVLAGEYGAGIAVQVAWVAFNLALVALQRYNRARMILTADKLLARGRKYSPDYKNWAGIDGRATRSAETRHSTLRLSLGERRYPGPGMIRAFGNPTGRDITITGPRGEAQYGGPDAMIAVAHDPAHPDHVNGELIGGDEFARAYERATPPPAWAANRWAAALAATLGAAVGTAAALSGHVAVIAMFASITAIAGLAALTWRWTTVALTRAVSPGPARGPPPILARAQWWARTPGAGRALAIAFTAGLLTGTVAGMFLRPHAASSVSLGTQPAPAAAAAAPLNPTPSNPIQQTHLRRTRLLRAPETTQSRVIPGQRSLPSSQDAINHQFIGGSRLRVVEIRNADLGFSINFAGQLNQ